MKTVILMAVGFMVCSGAFAQSGGAKSAAPVQTRSVTQQLARVEQQVAFLQARVNEAQARVNKRVAAISEQDKRVEDKINQVIKLLGTIKDSPASKTRITKTKQDVINGLNKSLEFYRQRRRARIQALKNESADFDDAENDVALKMLDEKMDERIRQISYITSTLTKPREWQPYEKYEYTVYGNNVERDESEAFVRNKKNLTRSNQQRDRTVAILKKNEADIKRENAKLEERLKTVRSEKDRKAIQGLIEQNNQRLANQNAAARKMVQNAHQPHKSLGREQAFDTYKWVETMAQEIVREHRQLVFLASQSKQDLFDLNIWQDRLKKAKAYEAQLKAQQKKSGK